MAHRHQASARRPRLREPTRTRRSTTDGQARNFRRAGASAQEIAAEVVAPAQPAGVLKPLGALGLIPDGPRPGREEIFGSVELDYKLVLNLLGLVIFTALFSLSRA